MDTVNHIRNLLKKELKNKNIAFDISNLEINLTKMKESSEIAEYSIYLNEYIIQWENIYKNIFKRTYYKFLNKFNYTNAEIDKLGMRYIEIMCYFTFSSEGVLKNFPTEWYCVKESIIRRK